MGLKTMLHPKAAVTIMLKYRWITRTGTSSLMNPITLQQINIMSKINEHELQNQLILFTMPKSYAQPNTIYSP